MNRAREVDRNLPESSYFEIIMVWESLSEGIDVFISWFRTPLQYGLPILFGGITALIGSYSGYIFDSHRQKMNQLREDVCDPMLNEIQSVKRGDIPDQTEWSNIDAISKHMLDGDISGMLDEYEEKLNEINNIEQDLVSFEMQILGQLGSSDGPLVEGESGLNIRVGKSYEQHVPDKFKFEEVPLPEFVKHLPERDREEYQRQYEPGMVENRIESWANSDDCPYNNLIRTWEDCSGQWRFSLASLFRERIYIYQDDVLKREKKADELHDLASDIEAELKKIIDQQFSFWGVLIQSSRSITIFSRYHHNSSIPNILLNVPDCTQFLDIHRYLCIPNKLDQHGASESEEVQNSH